jgi:enoyl-[acyl-carrier protein] reductase I
MGILKNRNILITGLLNSHSIAYGIARAAAREEANLAFTYQNSRLRDRVTRLASEFETERVFPCDVSKDTDISALFSHLGKQWKRLDGLVHSIAFAPREALDGGYLDGLTRDSFRIAHDISSYSFTALAREALPLMTGHNAALLTLTQLGAVRAVPHYNTMGPAKASLEANVRYLAQHLGKRNVRVNAISAGPIKTLAAAGIVNFDSLLKFAAEIAPLGRNVTVDEVGNAAVFLLSDLASGVTGQIVYVDAGINVIGVPDSN